MSEQRYLVIVPTYNERDNLPRKVPLILEQDEHIEVLVVDDASPDGTGALADALAAENDRVHVLHRDLKDGLGKAYLAGFAWGLDRGYELLFEMDADISHPPGALPVFIETAKDFDVVIGSRSAHGTPAPSRACPSVTPRAASTAGTAACSRASAWSGCAPTDTPSRSS
jgi:dolichol-phosphate mannosyltransferase